MGWLLDQIASWLLAVVLGIFNAVFDLIAHTLLITPDVTALPQFAALTGRSVWVVDTVFVLAFSAVGVLTMVAGGDERSRYTAKDLLPRLVVGFVAAHLSTPLLRVAITAANSLTGSLADVKLDGTGAFAAIHSHVAAAASDKNVPILAMIIIGIVACLLAMTLFGFLVRIAVLIVLATAAPLALACHALPQTEAVAHLWWRAVAGCLLTPVLQAFTLQAGAWMLLDLHQMLPEVGLPGDGTFINLFVVMVLLWTTVKIPGLVRRFASQGARSPNVVGMVVRVVVVQQLSRALPGVGRGLRR